MKLRHLVSSTFFIIILFMSYLAYHLGVLKPVVVDEGDFGPFKVVYKEHLGAYHKVVGVIEEVEKWTRTQNESCLISFGEYLDDPKMIEQSRLKSRGGCFVETDLNNLPEGFKQEEFAKRFYIHATFEGAPSIGPYKVYLKVANYMEERGLIPDGSVIETYRIHEGGKKMTTEYYFKAKKKY